MAIRRPGISRLHSFHQAPVARTGSGKQTEGAVYVNPGPISFSDGDQQLERIVGANVYVTGRAKNPSFNVADEFGDDPLRRYTFARERLAKPASQIAKVDCGLNRAAIKLLQVRERLV